VVLASINRSTSMNHDIKLRNWMLLAKTLSRYYAVRTILGYSDLIHVDWKHIPNALLSVGMLLVSYQTINGY